MMRRRFLLLLLAGTTMVCGAPLCWFFWPRTCITTENARRILVGMTLGEVEAILGGPGRSEATGAVIVIWGEDRKTYLPPRDSAPCLWVSDRAYILVSFGDSGLVESLAFAECEPAETLAERLYRYLGL